MKKYLWWIWCWSFICLPIRAQSDDLPNIMIQMPKSKGTTYVMLNRISELSGYLFMYDSEVVNSNRRVKIPAGTYTLEEAIVQATGTTVRMKVIDRHILLYQADIVEPSQSVSIPSVTGYLMLEGIVKDKESGEPIPYCTVGVLETGIGTVTNQNGQFLFKIPDSLRHVYIHFSHIGYEAQRLPALLLSESKADIYLKTRIVPLEAVIIHLANPQKIIKDMLTERSKNYISEPYYLTTFYREGVNHKKGFTNLTEAIFQVYKPGYGHGQSEQVKLIKMRSITNNQNIDTVVMKMKAGINASLMLDVIEHVPEFLVLSNESIYHYTKIGMAVTEDRLAHVIAFEQKAGISEPLYKGELYIDESNHALLGMNMQIHPDYIKDAQSMLVVKKARNMDIIPQEATYSATYQPWNGKYYIKHVRGDLYFKIKKKKRLLFGTTNVHTYFEMVTCAIDTLHVKRFPAQKSQTAHNIFSETNYTYDEAFWDGFNIIMPEEKLSDAISRISSKIEESVAEK